MVALSPLSSSLTAHAEPLSPEQILERMPNSHSDELQGIQRQLQTLCQGLQRVNDGQLYRLLDEDAKSALNKTLALLREVMPSLVKAVTLRSTQETEQIKTQKVIQQALLQAFPALAIVGTNPPNSQALLQVARWILIAETDLYFSWLLTPSGNLYFFEQEQPRLLRFLTRYVWEMLEQNTEYPFTSLMEVTIKQLREILSRRLNPTETATFKRIQEALAVELSANVVRLKQNGKSIQQGERA